METYILCKEAIIGKVARRHRSGGKETLVRRQGDIGQEARRHRQSINKETKKHT